MCVQRFFKPIHGITDPTEISKRGHFGQKFSVKVLCKAYMSSSGNDLFTVTTCVTNYKS